MQSIAQAPTLRRVVACSRSGLVRIRLLAHSPGRQLFYMAQHLFGRLYLDSKTCAFVGQMSDPFAPLFRGLLSLCSSTVMSCVD